MPLSGFIPTVEGFELDAYWEPERFVVELDVFETHGTRAAFERFPCARSSAFSM